MKRKYEAPLLEKVEFCFRDQIVAASGSFPGTQFNNDGSDICRHMVTGCTG